MKMNLRDGWATRLEAAQSAVAASDADFSWRAQLEARVMRFLLARYSAAPQAPPLGPLAVFEGAALYGQSRALLSQAQQRARLHHIAQVRLECPLVETSALNLRLEAFAYEQSQLKARRRQRYEARRERG